MITSCYHMPPPNTTCTLSLEGGSQVIAAIEKRGRVRAVYLERQSSFLDKWVATMQGDISTFTGA
jgi:hypothetical protein